MAIFRWVNSHGAVHEISYVRLFSSKIELFCGLASPRLASYILVSKIISSHLNLTTSLVEAKQSFLFSFEAKNESQHPRPLRQFSFNCRPLGGNLSIGFFVGLAS